MLHTKESRYNAIAKYSEQYVVVNGHVGFLSDTVRNVLESTIILDFSQAQ